MLALIIDIEDCDHVQRIADFIQDLGCTAVLVQDTEVVPLPSQRDPNEVTA
jgi:hypothetical protein